MEQLSKLLPAALNLAPAKQECKPSKIGDELKFIQSIQSAKISFEPVERIKELLRLVMAKVGVRATNMPNKEEGLVLIAHIIENYGNHTLEEIKLAFDMAISGKLGLEPKEVSCYENFSCLYVSSIINAYRKWASQTYKEIKTPPMKELPAVQLSDDEMNEWVEHTKIKYNKGQFEFNLIPISLYEYLTEKGKITGSKLEAWDKAKKMRVQDLQNEQCNPGSDKKYISDSLRYIREGDKNKNHPEYNLLVMVSKRIMLVDYFKKDL